MRFDDERKLLKGLQKREPRALEAAIARYGGYVMAVALRTLGTAGSRQDAEELASDTFTVLWTVASRLRRDSRLKPWLAVVTRNAALKRLRSLRPELAVGDMENLEREHFGTAADRAHPGTVADREHPGTVADRAHLEMADGPDGSPSAFETLPHMERELLERHYLDGESLRDLAAAAETTVPAVKSRLYRSRKILRRHLNDQAIG
ncbi:MAG: sigma-70 family RNA polymerase sigma factor [Coriobacteriales bacterium]|jgi:RNA polymerase sigma-70 factor (ECF subfamily)|nr:sigma-70 family RNA polymerase sigma factor [Coriobacteriales bacterium]